MIVLFNVVGVRYRSTAGTVIKCSVTPVAISSSDQSDIDSFVNRFFMILLKANNNEIISTSHEQFCFKLPGDLLAAHPYDSATE